MRPLLYAELTDWYRLVDPPADHRGEVAAFRVALERAASTPIDTLLELGAGAGHNALHLKDRFRCTLTDLSAEMSALSRALNPGCEHVVGDMRTLRLGRTFDAVLVHDAIMYMTTEADLAAAIETAFVHLREGGAAIFAPDFFRETFQESTNVIEADEGGRSLRCLEWTWDPDPSDTTCRVEYAFLLRDASGDEPERVEARHDRHVVGVFPRATWVRLLEHAGFRVETFERPIDDEGAVDEVFVCTR